MIGKHVVIDTLDNFKTKLSLIPSSAIVLIKDVGQIYAHGTYFGAQKTYSLLTKTADGLAPKGGTSASSLIKDGETEWVLTVTNGENPSWRRLPDNAFNSLQYTLPAATTTELGGIKVGKLYTATFSDLVGKYYKINIDKDGLAYVEVPWTDNDYRVEQVNTSVLDEDFRVTFSGTATNDTKTETLRKSSKLLFNPVSGKLTSTTFEGNLDGKYINKLTEYAIAKQAAAISVNDSLNTALGKLEYKTDVVYDLVDASKPDSTTIDTLKEVLNVLSGITDTLTIKGILGNYVTLAGNETITGLKTFESNSDTVGVSLILKNKGWLGNMATAMDFYNGHSYTVPNARIETRMVGAGNSGGTLIFYTQSRHDSTNPNPNGLTERLRIHDYGTITASTDLIVNKNITGAKLITNGGTSSQFLKGDGTLDSNLYYSVKGLKYNADQAWDWNDITEAGTYKIQTGKPIANHPKIDNTNNSYPYGLALILHGIKNDTEKRITLVYFPHDWVNYNNIPLYLRMRNGSNLTWTSWAKIPSVDFVTKLCAKYLPLTGGTLTNTLQIGSDNNGDFMALRLVRAGHAVTVNNTDKDAYLCFGSYANGSFTNEKALLIGDNGLLYSNDGNKSRYKIWHEGNDGIDSGLDADKLDGLHAIDISNYGVSVNPYSSSTGWFKFMTVTGSTNDGMVDFIISSAEVASLGIVDYYHFEMRPSETTRSFTYTHLGKNNDYLAANVYAYTTDNKVYTFYINYDIASRYMRYCRVKIVSHRGASIERFDSVFSSTTPSGVSYKATFSGAVECASKLSSSVNLWGNSFDGSSDLENNIIFPLDKGIYFNNSSKENLWCINTTSQNNGTIFYIRNIPGTFNALSILDSGNIGIGTNTPQYKLDVQGVISASDGYTIANSKYYQSKDKNGTSCGILSLSAQNQLILGYGTSSRGYETYIQGNRILLKYGTNNAIGLWLNSSGNITIGSSDAADTTYKLFVDGNMRAKGYYKESSSDSYVLLGGGGHKTISDLLLKSELTTIEKTLNVTADWMDTGIAGDNIPSNGSYIVQVSVKANDTTGDMWDCYWSGVMTWYVTGSNTKTNDTETDEILLHRSGHAYQNTIYLRTILTSGGANSLGVKLQIAANKNIGKEYKYTFKFKRII